MGRFRAYIEHHAVPEWSAEYVAYARLSRQLVTLGRAADARQPGPLAIVSHQVISDRVAPDSERQPLLASPTASSSSSSPPSSSPSSFGGAMLPGAHASPAAAAETTQLRRRRSVSSSPASLQRRHSSVTALMHNARAIDTTPERANLFTAAPAAAASTAAIDRPAIVDLVPLDQFLELVPASARSAESTAFFTALRGELAKVEAFFLREIAFFEQQHDVLTDQLELLVRTRVTRL